MIRRLLFNLWYFQKPPWDTGISPPELMDFIRSHPRGRALDLGCGTGTNVITLALHGWQASGIDFAPRAIRIARQKAHQAGLEVDLRVGDVTRLESFDGPFDLALDMGCFHNLSLEGKAAYTRGLKRLLAPGGAYLLYAFLKPAGAEGAGVDENDINRLCASFRLVERQDGSNRGGKPSAWFHFRQPLQESPS